MSFHNSNWFSSTFIIGAFERMLKKNYKICFLFKTLKISIVILFCLTSHVFSGEIYDVWDYETLLANFPEEAQGLGPDPYSPPDLLKENPQTYALVLSAEVLRYKASPDMESRRRIRAGTKWLLNNKHMDKNDCKGWGFPEAWDAFGDGTINPENHEYTITNAMALESLLNAISINSFWETEEAGEIKKVIKQVSLYWCKNVWTSNKDGSYFWYSVSPNDSHFVTNVSAMFLGVLARTLKEQDNIFTREEYVFIQRKIDKSADTIISKVNWRSGAPFWNYMPLPNFLNQEKPNDSVHHSYILWGMELYRSWSSDVKLPWTHKQAIESLNLFWKDKKVFDYPQDVLYEGDQSHFNSRPANLWGLGMMLNFYARWGDLTKAKDCLYAISSNYGAWPRLRIWPKSFLENKFFYPRYVSHVLWGLATYKFYSNTFQNSDSNKNTTFNSTHLYNPAGKIIEQDVRILRPFLWGHKQSDREIFSEKSLNNSELLENPLKLARNTLWLLKSGHSEKNQAKLLSAKTNLQYILNAKSLIKDQTRMSWALLKHNDIPDGWWSCMNNAIIALDLQVASEIFQDKNYEITARKVINSMLQTPDYGGSLLWLGENKCWFSEYTWPNITTEKEYFVLNGFLFSLQALKFIADSSGEWKYHRLFRAAVEGYKSIAEQFHYQDSSWCWYMLNPKTINQDHYVIYEIMQLDSLYDMTGNDFFKKEADYRRNILEKWFPLYVIKTQGKQNYEFLFSRIGPPHPYAVDIYPQRLVFVDEDNNKVGVEYSTPKNVKQASRLERFFITGIFQPQAKKCLVYSVYNNDAFCLFEFPLSRNEFDFSSQYKQLPFALSGEFDAKETSAHTVTVKPSFNILPDNLEHYANKQGRIKLKLKEHLNMDALLHLGLLISPDININIGVRIFDENNKSAFRYYLPLSGKEENLVLLNWLGFDNYNNLSKNITEIVIYIYTDKLKKEGMSDFSVKVNSLIGFENNIELYKFFKEKQFAFPE